MLEIPEEVRREFENADPIHPDDGCRMLWREVIARHVMDSIGHVQPYSSGKPNLEERNQTMRTARAWIKFADGFRTVCRLAGLNPDIIRPAIANTVVTYEEDKT